MTNTVLITGGAGFIGSNLVRYINNIRPASQVVVIDDFSTGLESNLSALNCKVVRGSILDEGTLAESARGANSIIHLAALGSVPRSVEDPITSHEVNVNGTVQVLEVARRLGINHIVMASSSSVYGSNPSEPRRETDWTQPVSPYGATKLASESYGLAYASTYGLEVLPLRFFNVYGPLQRSDHPYAAVIPKFVHQALLGEVLDVHGDGEQTRDFTYVDSVCAVIADAIDNRSFSMRPLNLAFGTQTTINELVRILSELLGTEVAVNYGDSRKGDVRTSQADPTSLLAAFPRHKPVRLSDGLTKTIEWAMSTRTD